MSDILYRLNGLENQLRDRLPINQKLSGVFKFMVTEEDFNEICEDMREFWDVYGKLYAEEYEEIGYEVMINGLPVEKGPITAIVFDPRLRAPKRLLVREK